MKASTKRSVLLAVALAAAMFVAGCGGGGVTEMAPPPATVDAFLTDVTGTSPIEAADQGDQVYVVAKVPADATSVQASIQVGDAPVPPEGTTLKLNGPGAWPLGGNYGRAFTVPGTAPVGTIYVIQVTVQTPGGTLQSDLLTLTVTGGMPCTPVSAWFQGYTVDPRKITAAKGSTVTILALPFGTASAVQANIQGTPVPPQGSTIPLTTGSWPSPATHGGSFTVPTAASSGAKYFITVIATFPTCDGISPTLELTVQ